MEQTPGCPGTFERGFFLAHVEERVELDPTASGSHPPEQATTRAREGPGLEPEVGAVGSHDGPPTVPLGGGSPNPVTDRSMERQGANVNWLARPPTRSFSSRADYRVLRQGRCSWTVMSVQRAHRASKCRVSAGLVQWSWSWGRRLRMQGQEGVVMFAAERMSKRKCVVQPTTDGGRDTLMLRLPHGEKAGLGSHWYTQGRASLSPGTVMQLGRTW
jgi:hypothetical protein